MSEYLRVLTRLEQDAHAAPAAAAPSTAPARPAPAVSRPPVTVVRDRRPTDGLRSDGGAFATLYDNLRAAVASGTLRRLVVVDAGEGAGATAVTDGLAAHVRALGGRVRVAKMERADGRPAVRVRADAGDGGGASIPLELPTGASPDTVRAAFGPGGESDLLVIDAGALTDSIDPALLACGCDGLVIAVRAGRTNTEALRAAVERARKVGAPVLGTVVSVPPASIPPWRRRSRESR
jgi:Mrp family chromosome partitioning ATPase